MDRTRGVHNKMTDSERCFEKMLISSERSSQIEKKDMKNSSGERGLPNEKGKKASPTDTSSRKEKQPAKSSLPKNKSTSNPTVDQSEIENKILEAISNLQSTIKKQNEKMNDHDRQLKDFASKLATYEYDDHENDFFEGGYCEEYDDQDDEVRSEIGSVDHGMDSTKRKVEDDENNNSRFKAMSKQFKASESVDSEIDRLLAENVTELFRCGIDEVRYNELIKDENTARPSNCEGLVVVQTNPLIWESLGAPARSVDKKMQNIETSVVKSATKLAKVVDKMAKMEDTVKNDSFSKMIDECNDVLALLGQSNKQINLARKDFLRPELNKEYSHLCNHNK